VWGEACRKPYLVRLLRVCGIVIDNRLRPRRAMLSPCRNFPKAGGVTALRKIWSSVQRNPVSCSVKSLGWRNRRVSDLTNITSAESRPLEGLDQSFRTAGLGSNWRYGRVFFCKPGTFVRLLLALEFVIGSVVRTFRRLGLSIDWKSRC
jgi:hypothetical protein